MDIGGFVSVLLGAAAAMVALVATYRAVSMEARLRDRLADEQAGFATAVKKARADLGELAETVEEMIEKARNERRRANGQKGGRPPATPERVWDRESYMAHLESGGRVIPDVEAGLGL